MHDVKNIPLWSQPWRGIVSEELSAALSEVAVPRTLKAGECLYKRGDPGRDLMGVAKGRVRMVAVSADGHEMLAGLYPEGTWFGELSVFDSLPRPFDAYADLDCELRVLPGEVLKDLLDRNPQWYQDFARVVCYKLRHALEHIENQYKPVQVRVVRRLLDLARSYGKPIGQAVQLDLVLSQEAFGNMLGITRQTVNKELGVLKAQGHIRHVAGVFELLNVPALEGIARSA